MASLFNITTATGSVSLDAQRTGKVVFTVSNTSPTTVDTCAHVTTPESDSLPWFTIEGLDARTLTPGTTEQYMVRIAIPPEAAAKDYTFSLLMVSEKNPDEDFTEGPAVKIVGLKPSPEPPKKPFPWWIVVVGAVLLVVIIVVLGSLYSQAQADIRSTQDAANTATAVMHGLATQTAAAAQTQTAQANAQATQTAAVPKMITVESRGGFVVEHISISYDTPTGPQSNTYGDFPLGQDLKQPIPGNATNISVRISYYGTNTLCWRYYPKATTVTIRVSGVLPNPDCKGG